jgi:hypothetical protein
MELDDPNYIVSFMLNREDWSLVDVNVRLQGAHESSAETNSLSLDELTRIFLDGLKYPQEQVDGIVQRLQSHRNVVIYMHSMDAIRKPGLLGPA